MILTLRGITAGFFALVLFLFIATSAEAAPVSTTINPSGDTFTNTFDRTVNHDGKNFVRVQDVNNAATKYTNTKRGFVQFDVASTVPTSTQLDSATLRLNVINVILPGTVQLSLIDGTWDASTLRLQNHPTMDLATFAEFDVVASDAGTYIEVDVTAQVQDWIDGTDVNNGFLLSPNTVGVRFSSAETANPMELVLNYDDGVVPNTAPQITVLGDNPLTHPEGDVYVDPGATASDAEDGDITGSIIVTGDVITPSTTPGTYLIEYAVVDSGGLLASGTRSVIVEEVVAQRPFIMSVDVPSSGTTYTINTNGDYVYDYVVDWGDGTVTNETGTASYTYTQDFPGEVETIQIQITGEFPAYQYNNYGPDLAVSIDQWGDIAWKTMDRFFSGGLNDEAFINATDTPNLSEAESMRYLFGQDEGFNDFDVPNNYPYIQTWDTSNIKDMTGIFYGSGIEGLDLSAWDVSSLEVMDYMFFGSVLDDSLNMENWDVSNVKSMQYTFFAWAGASDLEDLANWDVSSLENLDFAFSQASFANELAGWDTSSLTSMVGTFQDALGDDTIPTFDFTGWDVSNVTDMTSAFQQFDPQADVDLTGWDMSSVVTTESMFQDMVSDGELLISGLQTGSVQNMDNMFNSININDISGNSIGAWDISSVTSMVGMFDDSGLNEYSQVLIGWAAQEPNIQSNVELGAQGLDYLDIAYMARDVLTNTYNWNIVGDFDGGEASP